LSALAVHFKATYSQMKLYIWLIVGLVPLGRLVDFIVSRFTDSSQNTSLSDGNLLLLILLVTSIALPLSYYRRIVHLGASRAQYFKGLQSVFVVWAAAVALFNSIWFEFEEGVLRKYTNTVDLIEAFRWVDFGFAGSFLYQMAFYLMAMALLSMLISGYRHPVGWLLWALLLAAIPVGTTIPSLRDHVGSFFQALLFNGSLLTGVGFNLLLYLVFVAGGWFFTRRRTH